MKYIKTFEEFINESVNEGFTKSDWDVKWKMPKDNLFNATKTKNAVDNRYKALQNLLKDKPKELKAFDSTDDHPAYNMSYDELMKWYNNLSESVLNEENLKYKDTGLKGEYLRDVKNAVKAIKNALKAGNKKSASEVTISNYDIIQQRVQQYGLGSKKYDFLDAVKKLAGIDESVVNEAKMPVNKENIEHYIGAYSVDDDPYDVAVEIGGQYGWSQRDIEKAEKLIRKHYIR